MALLLMVAAVVDGFLLDEWVDAVAISAIVVLNTVIALVQQGRATRALDALREFEVPTARVRRGGRTRQVPARDLVEGDLVLLDAGDRIPADLHLRSAHGLEIDEAVLTGESVPTQKQVVDEPPGSGDVPVGDRSWMAFSGTLVTRGAGRGVVTATGPRTEFGRIAAGLRAERLPTPLQRQLARLTAVLGVAAIGTALAVAALVFVRASGESGALEEAFLAGVALAVAAVPEGLATVTAVGLALGVRRMAHRGAIIRRLPAVETLGSTTVLAFDKTGTVTENRMTLETVIVAGSLPGGFDDVPEPIQAAVLEAAGLCSDASLEPTTGDPLEIALLEPSGAERVDAWRKTYPRVVVAPFDAERKRMATAHESPDGEAFLVVKGAPEVILARCARALATDGEVPLDDEERNRLLVLVGDLASKGTRTLALARRSLESIPDDLSDVEKELTLIALVGLRDPVRAGAPATVEALRGAGLRLLMVTGDHPGTAASVARTVGLSAEEVVTGRDLAAGSLPLDPASVSVYARVDPSQKLALVDGLHRREEVVAMTGDGVNDAPALRAADIGVALGRTGSDVTREAADMVITDDDLATIGVAVQEGRGIYANIRNVVDYLVAGNLSEIAVMLTALLAFPALGVPLLPLQILWVNLLTDGLPAVALGRDPIDPGVMRDPPRPAAEPILDGPRVLLLARRAVILAAAPLAVLVISRYGLDHEWPHARGALFTTLVMTHILYAFAVRRLPGGRLRGLAANPWLVVTVVASIALQWVIVAWAPAQEVFATEPLLFIEWVLAGTVSLVVVSVVAWVRAHERTTKTPTSA